MARTAARDTVFITLASGLVFAAAVALDLGERLHDLAVGAVGVDALLVTTLFAVSAVLAVASLRGSRLRSNIDRRLEVEDRLCAANAELWRLTVGRLDHRAGAPPDV